MTDAADHLEDPFRACIGFRNAMAITAVVVAALVALIRRLT